MLLKAVVAVLVSAGIALCQRDPRRAATAPEPPLKDLVAINEATMTYYSWLKHVPTSLKQLGPTGGKVADANAADLITPDLASGTHNGFSFTLKGTRSGWTVRAVPLRGAKREFQTTYTLETHISNFTAKPHLRARKQ